MAKENENGERRSCSAGNFRSGRYSINGGGKLNKAQQREVVIAIDRALQSLECLPPLVGFTVDIKTSGSGQFLASGSIYEQNNSLHAQSGLSELSQILESHSK